MSVFTMTIGAQSILTSSYQFERFLMRCLVFQVMGFMWLEAFDFNDDVERVPLIQFDFEHFREEV